MGAIERTTTKRAAYDCIRDNASCPSCEGKYPDMHSGNGSNHGNHCEEWYFVLKHPHGALELRVWTPFRHPLTPPSTLDEFSCQYIGYHSAWPVGREGLRDKGTECAYFDWASGERCYGNESPGLTATKAFIEHLDQDAGIDEQPEHFWRALEALHDKFLTEAHAERTSDKWEACDRCDGDGIREKKLLL